METKPRVIVVGGGYAGVMAALRAARRLRHRGEVVLVSDRDAMIERVRLHEAAAGIVDPARPLAKLLRGTSVRIVRARVESVDRVGHEITLSGGERMRFDRLIVAIGSRVDASAIPGAREHAHTLEPDGFAELEIAVREAARREGHLVVIGGGLTGIEGATELAERHRGLRVTLVTSGAIGPGLAPRAVDHLRRTFARLGITLREHARVERVDPDAVVIAGERVPFDVCVGAVGFAIPESLRTWGFPVDARGRARVDAMLRLEGVSDVYVAGDCAAPSGVLGSELPFGCKSAMPMGVHAAENAVRSLRDEPERAIDWSDTAYCISLGRRDGLVQLMTPQGTPRATFLSGRLGAMVKEMICRYTVRSVELERDGWWDYRFLRVRLHALPSRELPSPREAA
ncbi:NAD(P)/FAD-dependent oxidoreductase [Sandaracinus amylolyticus]|uniref:NAD(P)/FAD-dependent oxidoreductase n=1 Tax=Sandaracinus amylolyticus TaxID=927083 RepID=UPI001F35BBA4|nr:FAD-dependent oxidoreductase [Sandaracinus amylolyticus]UJR81570.1 FAD-dependent pyridine nucleotide-disulfide oxidoreductase [Sandaracinus amylolyticus]